MDESPPNVVVPVTSRDAIECDEEGDDEASDPLTDDHYSSFSIPRSSRVPSLLEQTLFFASGLGTSLCYIATLSSLVYFKILYGASSFAFLNLAVYLPLLPISLAQALWDQYYDLRYASRNTFLARGVVGFLLGLLGTLQMINHTGLFAVVVNALLQGTGGAILYGTLNQLASFAASDDDDGTLQTAVSAGVQASALIVLVVDIATGFGVHEASRFSTFLWSIVAIEVLCFVSFLWLLRARPLVAAAMVGRDSWLRPDSHLLHGDDQLDAPLIESSISQQGSATELSFTELWSRTKESCWILAITLVPSFLVGSWFTRVQTNWAALASWLFYVRIGSDLLGRIATIIIPPRTLRCLRHTSAIRIQVVAAFFLNAHGTLQFRGMAADALSIVLVAIISCLSGYLVTGAYQLAPLGLDPETREANAAKQASLLTVAFAVSAIGGLLSSFALMALGV
jgi:hypothetical protein